MKSVVIWTPKEPFVSDKIYGISSITANEITKLNGDIYSKWNYGVILEEDFIGLTNEIQYKKTKANEDPAYTANKVYLIGSFSYGGSGLLENGLVKSLISGSHNQSVSSILSGVSYTPAEKIKYKKITFLDPVKIKGDSFYADIQYIGNASAKNEIEITFEEAVKLSKGGFKSGWTYEPFTQKSITSTPPAVISNYSNSDASKKDDSSSKKLYGLSNSELASLDWSQVKLQTISKEELKKLDWSSVKTSTFTAETYSQLDWSTVKVGAFSQESKKTLDWQKVKIGGADGASTESLSTTDLFQYNAANGKAVVDYKKTNLNQFKFGEFSESSYEAINWSKVNFKGITAETYSQMDFSEVITSKGFSAATYKSVDWSKVDYGDFKAETYQKTDWSKVSFGKLSSSSYSAMDWSQVVTSTGFKAATYKAVNWGLVDFGDYKAETYQKTDWSKVNFKQFSASSYSSLDWSKVVTASGFNAAAYKSVNWGQVDFGDFKQQTFATTNWNQVNFKQLSASQYQAINWNEINLGALSTKTYKAIDWKKVNVAAFDAESVATAKWSLMKGVTKPTAAAKPAEADLSFLGVTAASGSTGGLIGAAEQSSSSQYPVLVNSAETPKPFIM